jgi:glycosyltransferase involved in cell wall biosynthesis
MSQYIQKNIKILITIGLLLAIIFFINKNKVKQLTTKVESFDNKPSDFGGSPVFVPLYADDKTKLNVMLISKPFPTDSDYKLYMNNKNKYIYIGISSYMEFPGMPSNPLDKFKIEHFSANAANSNPYNIKMYQSMAEGWLHCFRKPCDYIPCDLPHALISESDFVNTDYLKPDDEQSSNKEFDFVYNCPKVNKNSGCNDWVSYNKNWELALKCLPILCEKFKLKGLLIGREGCELPEKCKPYLTTTAWVEYEDVIKLYKKCKFLFLPNTRDASPRVITECMSLNLPCLVNNNIVGGWKYINDTQDVRTGEFFNDENDIEEALKKLLDNMKNNKYEPRRFILENYGPINSGIKLKEFLFEHFRDRLNIKDAKYITIRNPM